MLRISVLSQISIRVALATLLGLASLMAGAAERTTTYLHTDHLGSPILARSAAGTTVWQDDYGPWGESLQTPAGNAGDVGYTGHYTESGLGLTYAQARWYDQVAGVFLSPDMVRYEEGGYEYFHRYWYASANPVVNYDPDGKAVKTSRYPTCFEITCDQLGRAKGGGVPRGGHLDSAGGRGTSASTVKEGAANGPRAGKSHTRGAVKEAKRRNSEENGGDVLCTSCGVKTTPATRRTKGSTVNPREGQGDHIYPRSKGGNGATVKDQTNIDIKCAACNNLKSDSI